jgi:hypothetical protein
LIPRRIGQLAVGRNITLTLTMSDLQSKVLCTIGNFPSRTPVQEFTIILQNYAVNEQKLYKITKMQMSAIYGKAKLDTENIRDLNLAAVKRTTVQVPRLLL